jgi:hypothetical protein
VIRRAALTVLVGLLSAAPATAHTISSGVITVGRGANGVELGMTRAQVVKKLGRPNAENGLGTMSYGADSANIIFDVYRLLDPPHTVREFVIASPHDPHFRLSDGNRIFTKGGLRRLAKHYGKALRFHRFDDGSPYYELVTRFHGKTVKTAFPTDKRGLDAYVQDVFIAFA